MLVSLGKSIKVSETVKETVMKTHPLPTALSSFSTLLLKHKNAQQSFAILSKKREDILGFFSCLQGFSADSIRCHTPTSKVLSVKFKLVLLRSPSHVVIFLGKRAASQSFLSRSLSTFRNQLFEEVPNICAQEFELNSGPELILQASHGKI